MHELEGMQPIKDDKKYDEQVLLLKHSIMSHKNGEEQRLDQLKEKLSNEYLSKGIRIALTINHSYTPFITH